MKPNFIFPKIAKSFCAFLILLALAACQSLWDTPPDYGTTVNNAIQAQLVNPNAPVGNKKVTTGLDGPAAKGAVDNYQKSFEIRLAPAASSSVYTTVAPVGTSK